jgi:hypothetical protein
VLELSKALSFFASIVSLYSAAIYAFFDPAARWEERLWVMLSKLAIAACICFCSGLLFCWPSPTNPDAEQSLTSTLPVQMFFWAAAGIGVAFVAFWYLVTAAPCIATVNQSCGVR